MMRRNKKRTCYDVPEKLKAYQEALGKILGGGPHRLLPSAPGPQKRMRNLRILCRRAIELDPNFKTCVSVDNKLVVYGDRIDSVADVNLSFDSSSKVYLYMVVFY